MIKFVCNNCERSWNINNNSWAYTDEKLQYFVKTHDQLCCVCKRKVKEAKEKAVVLTEKQTLKRLSGLGDLNK